MFDMAPKRGRPSAYTPELGQLICDRIAGGETLVSVCKGPKMPTITTVLRWPDPAFRELYARAKEIRLEVMAEEIREISDKCRPGDKVEKKHVGWVCPQCALPVEWRGKVFVHVVGPLEYSPLCEGVKKPDPVYETKTVSADMIERARLQVDARKWLLARLASKTYGDRVSQEVSGPGGAAIQSEHRIVFVTPKENA
jgi:hypothetical protein